MNAAIVLSFHGSFKDMLDKWQNDTSRISEFLLIRKYSERFDKILVFSHDSRNYREYLPENFVHIRLYNRPIYILFGWIFVLLYSIKYKVRIIHVECGPALPPMFLVNKLTNAKTFLNYDNTWFLTTSNPMKREVLRMLERFLIKFVDYFVVASAEIRDFVGKGNILPVKKGIIVSEFDPDSIKEDIALKRMKGPKLIFVGRLHPIKDPMTAIRAYKIVRKEIKDLRLVMCGDGELFDECERASDDGVIFLKFTKKIPSLLKASDIFILTSVYDASPRSLMEAMCMGKPCIATSVGGIPDYLDSECGVLIEPGNPELLAKEITYLLKNPHVAASLGRKARERMLKEHDIGKNIDKVLDILTGGKE
jgi:glycosyltransferase involved in cell wall biosynthesis